MLMQVLSVTCATETQDVRWQFGVAVTALGVSTKLLYVEPGEYWDG